jgi:hypothetical protein
MRATSDIGAAGYLVTDPRDAGQPLAFVMGNDGNADKYAFRLARNILVDSDDACRTGFHRGIEVVDLRPYCRSDSNAPPPHWLHGMALHPAADDGEALDYGFAKVLPQFFDRFVVDGMQQRAQEVKKAGGASKVVAAPVVTRAKVRA